MPKTEMYFFGVWFTSSSLTHILFSDFLKGILEFLYIFFKKSAFGVKN